MASGKVKGRGEELDLAGACLELRLSRERAMRLIFEGRLDGRRDENGRWRITTSSVANVVRELATQISA